MLISIVLLSVSFVARTKASDDASVTGPKNFIFFERQRQRIAEPAFLENDQIAGAQLKYTWRELEPERDRYELRPLLDDLAFLKRHGKQLFVQLQDVSFSEEVLVPDYLRTDPDFGGGAARKYEYEGGHKEALINKGSMLRDPRYDGGVWPR